MYSDEPYIQPRTLRAYGLFKFKIKGFHFVISFRAAEIFSHVPDARWFPLFASCFRTACLSFLLVCPQCGVGCGFSNELLVLYDYEFCPMMPANRY